MVEVVAALIRRGDTFLACRRPAHKARGLQWEFLGGKVEMGETGEQTLVRECREELGVTVQPTRALREVTHTYPDITVHLTLFEAIIVEGEPQALEHSEIRWMTAQEAAEADFSPADRAFLPLICPNSEG